MEAPGTPKEIVLQLQKEYGYSVIKIAHAISVAPKTIYNILHDETPNCFTDFALLRFYVQLKIEEDKKNAVREPRAVYEIITNEGRARKGSSERLFKSPMTFAHLIKKFNQCSSS